MTDLSWVVGLTADDEGVHQPVDRTGWSENYLTQFYAPDARIGFFFHQGRTAFDPALWNYFFIAYLPDDRFAVANGYGYGESATGPAGCGSYLRCEEPFVRWTNGFRGAATVVAGAELRAGPFAEGQHVLLDVELTVDSLGPPFDLSLNNNTWATSHYEQHGVGTGHLSINGSRTELRGSGLRDHSWGPRDMSGIDRHAWLHGQFPSGRTFMVFRLRAKDGQDETHAVVGDHTGLTVAELVSEPPLLDNGDAASAPYELVLAVRGQQIRIEAEILQVAPCSLSGPSELLLGTHHGPTTHHHLLEAQTRFRWDGEVGYGLTDRTVRR